MTLSDTVASTRKRLDGTDLVTQIGNPFHGEHGHFSSADDAIAKRDGGILRRVTRSIGGRMTAHLVRSNARHFEVTDNPGDLPDRHSERLDKLHAEIAEAARHPDFAHIRAPGLSEHERGSLIRSLRGGGPIANDEHLKAAIEDGPRVHALHTHRTIGAWTERDRSEFIQRGQHLRSSQDLVAFEGLRRGIVGGHLTDVPTPHSAAAGYRDETIRDVLTNDTGNLLRDQEYYTDVAAANLKIVGDEHNARQAAIALDHLNLIHAELVHRSEGVERRVPPPSITAVFTRMMTEPRAGLVGSSKNRPPFPLALTAIEHNDLMSFLRTGSRADKLREWQLLDDHINAVLLATTGKGPAELRHGETMHRALDAAAARLYLLEHDLHNTEPVGELRDLSHGDYIRKALHAHDAENRLSATLWTDPRYPAFVARRQQLLTSAQKLHPSAHGLWGFEDGLDEEHSAPSITARNIATHLGNLDLTGEDSRTVGRIMDALTMRRDPGTFPDPTVNREPGSNIEAMLQHVIADRHHFFGAGPEPWADARLEALSPHERASLRDDAVNYLDNQWTYTSNTLRAYGFSVGQRNVDRGEDGSSSLVNLHMGFFVPDGTDPPAHWDPTVTDHTEMFGDLLPLGALGSVDLVMAHPPLVRMTPHIGAAYAQAQNHAAIFGPRVKGRSFILTHTLPMSDIIAIAGVTGPGQIVDAHNRTLHEHLVWGGDKEGSIAEVPNESLPFLHGTGSFGTGPEFFPHHNWYFLHDKRY